MILIIDHHQLLLTSFALIVSYFCISIWFLFFIIFQEYNLLRGAGSSIVGKNSKPTTVRTANKGVVTYEFYTSNNEEKNFNIFNRKNDTKNTVIGPKRKQAVANFNGMLVVLDLNEPHETVLTSESDIIAALSFEHRRPLGKQIYHFLYSVSLYHFLYSVCFYHFSYSVCFYHFFYSFCFYHFLYSVCFHFFYILLFSIFFFIVFCSFLSFFIFCFFLSFFL